MFKSKIYLNDLENQYNRIDFSKFINKKILVTGACGLICSYLIDLLIYANMNHNANITIYALSRSKQKIMNRFDYYFDNELFKPVIQDVCNKINIEDVDYIIHGASNANPKLFIQDSIGTLNANYIGTLNVLELAKKCNAKVLYISSSDVYGEQLNSDKILVENDYGYIDIHNIRSSYALAKRAAETLCVCYKQQYECDVKIVRPAHIYGPTYTEGDTRAVSDFLRNAVKGEKIVMKSDGSSKRSYCYVGDTVVAILKIINQGNNGEAYNISNENNFISIKDLANKIATYANKKLIIELPNDEISKKVDSNVKTIKMSSSKLEKLDWKPIIDIDTGIKICLEVRKEIV